MIELLTSVKHAIKLASGLPDEFLRYWKSFQVDAATPLPLDPLLDRPSSSSSSCWQSSEGWVSSDSDWVVWTGRVHYERVEWKAPMRSSVPALMDGGDGPPMLDVGCIVLRAVDWEKDGSGAKSVDEDGKDTYDTEKTRRDQEKRKAKEAEEKSEGSRPSSNPDQVDTSDVPGEATLSENPAEQSEAEASSREIGETGETSTETRPEESKKKKVPSPKLATGTVLSIEPWNGIAGLGRRVRWHLTGIEGVYRFGGDGGRFDICHIETNKKATRVKRRHPLPETA
jgi:hypothetical protein